MPGDAERIVAARDDEHRRWLGPGAEEPRPTFVIEVDGAVVGWLDVDPDQDWLHEGEANVGYFVFPVHRGHGYAAAALRLHHGDETLVAIVDPANAASIATVTSAGFVDVGIVDHDGRPNRRFERRPS